jgi:hypothetical protein
MWSVDQRSKSIVGSRRTCRGTYTYTIPRCPSLARTHTHTHTHTHIEHSTVTAQPPRLPSHVRVAVEPKGEAGTWEGACWPCGEVTPRVGGSGIVLVNRAAACCFLDARVGLGASDIIEAYWGLSTNVTSAGGGGICSMIMWLLTRKISATVDPASAGNWTDKCFLGAATGLLTCAMAPFVGVGRPLPVVALGVCDILCPARLT